MRATEHILVDIELRNFLDKNKKDSKETYNEVLRRLLKLENISYKDERRLK